MTPHTTIEEANQCITALAREASAIEKDAPRKRAYDHLETALDLRDSGDYTGTILYRNAHRLAAALQAQALGTDCDRCGCGRSNWSTSCAECVEMDRRAEDAQGEDCFERAMALRYPLL